MTNPLSGDRYDAYISHPFYPGKSHPTMEHIIKKLCATKIECKSALTIQSTCPTENLNSAVEFLQLANSILIFCDAKQHFKQDWNKGLKRGMVTGCENELFGAEMDEIERRLKNGRLQDLVIVKEGESEDSIPRSLQQVQRYNKNDIWDIVFGISTGHSDEPITV